jgi:nucleoside-diphosphate-sugar epimerase
MNVFLTGASGVIGQRAVPLLLAAGHAVTAVVRKPERGAALDAAGARVIVVDLFDPAAVRAAVSGHDAIVHLATHMPRLDWHVALPGAWRENDRLRRAAAANLAAAAIDVRARRYVQESFAPAYPDCGERWIDEDVPLAPARYNRSVLDAEAAAWRFSLSGGAGIVLRFASFYGPDAEQTQGLIGAVREGWAPLPGRPDAFLSSVSHDDAATAVVAALRLSPGIYNVADDEPLRRREYVDSLARALGVPAPRLAPPWTRHLLGSVGRLLARSQRISNRKLRRDGAWAPRQRNAREGWAALVASACGER